MTKKMVKHRNAYLKEIYPHIWNQYVFNYNEKTKKYELRFSTILIITNIILFLYIQAVEQSIFKELSIFHIPLIFLILPIIISLFNLIPRTMYVPFFDEKKLKKIFDKKENFFETIPHLKAYQWKKQLAFELSLHSVIMSILLILLIVTDILSNSNRYISVGFTTLVFVVFFLILFFSHREYPVKKDVRKIRKFLDGWFNEK
jgi:hypothetical protein